MVYVFKNCNCPCRNTEWVITKGGWKKAVLFAGELLRFGLGVCKNNNFDNIFNKADVF
jgi:hypothetical protein